MPTKTPDKRVISRRTIAHLFCLIGAKGSVLGRSFTNHVVELPMREAMEIVQGQHWRWASKEEIAAHKSGEPLEPIPGSTDNGDGSFTAPATEDGPGEGVEVKVGEEAAISSAVEPSGDTEAAEPEKAAEPEEVPPKPKAGSGKKTPAMTTKDFGKSTKGK